MMTMKKNGCIDHEKTSLKPSDVIVHGQVRGALGIEPVEKQKISPFPLRRASQAQSPGYGF